MLPIRSVLFPVDFSPRSASAAGYAAALTTSLKADLKVLHVAEGHAPYTDLNDICLSPGTAVDSAWIEIRQNAAAETMKEFIRSHLKSVRPTPCIAAGDPAKVIVDYAHASNIDLIVMPTHGHGRFRRMLLGSITAKVLHDADCPVFTSAHMEIPPEQGNPFHTILCAVNLGPHSETTLKWAAEFSRNIAARLYLVHFTSQTAEATERLKKLLESTQSRAELIVENADVVEGLRDQVKTSNADLVVIGRHHTSGMRGRLRDTAYAIVRESPCPVVSV